MGKERRKKRIGGKVNKSWTQEGGGNEDLKKREGGNKMKQDNGTKKVKKKETGRKRLENISLEEIQRKKGERVETGREGNKRRAGERER